MRGRRAVRCLFSLACLLMCLFGVAPAHAYPWTIKHGFFKCGSCHTDVSGGETLTHMGRAEAEQLLGWSASSAGAPHRYSQFLFGALPEPGGLRLGGSYRHMLLYTARDGRTPSTTAQFPMQADVYGQVTAGMFVAGGSIGVARGITGSANARSAQLNRELGEGWLLLSRSHFLGVQLDPWTLLRAGRLALPFGLRIPEHVLWVREATRTDRESDQQHGLGLAYAQGPLRAEGMVIAGNFQIYPDRYRERGYSAYAEYLLTPTAALGASSLLTFANEDRLTQQKRAVRQAHALTARVGLSPQWALLGEADLLKDGKRGWGGAGLVQLDYEALRGLHLVLTSELVDLGAPGGGRETAPGNGEPRMGGWLSLDLHFYSHLELRFDLVQRQESPLSAQAQLHLFL
jgi:hypothetical protein